LKCPDIKCGKELVFDDLRVILTKEDIAKYEDFRFNLTIDQGEKFSWCPTPNCNLAFEYDEEDEIEFFKCERCKKEYCLHCRVPVHKGMTCQEY
jgi:hypothetical protein